MYIPTEPTVGRSTVVPLTMWMKLSLSSPAIWCRSSSGISTASKHASSSRMTRRQKTKGYHSWMCVCAESLTSLSLATVHHGTGKQHTPTNTCPLIYTILWHTRWGLWWSSVLSSNGMECVAEEKGIVDTLKENGYPLRFIHRHSHCM